jgi:hypothetical protein
MVLIRHAGIFQRIDRSYAQALSWQARPDGRGHLGLISELTTQKMDFI